MNVIIGEIDTIPNLVPDLKNIPKESRNGMQLPFPNSPATGWIRNIISAKFSFLENNVPATPVEPLKIEWDEKLQTRLYPLVLGLLRMDRLGSAMQLYKDTLLQRIKFFTKKVNTSLTLVLSNKYC